MCDIHVDLSAEDKQVLLMLARNAIRKELGLPNPAEAVAKVEAAVGKGSLARDGATFVTLTLGGHLRGCIGSLVASRPLAEDVERNAVSAAFRDTRFAPVSPDEVDALHIEISLLTLPVPLAYADADDLLKKLKPGVDGVVLKKGFYRATFLPQVWDQLPRPSAFLGHLSMKAGLPVDAWKNENPDIEIYRVLKFEE